MNTHEAWSIRRLLCGNQLNGELAAVAEPFRSVAAHLATLPPEVRPLALDGFLCGRADRDTIRQTLAQVDPLGPAPQMPNVRSFATLADVARVVTSQRWVWPNWLGAGVLNALAAEPGIGKSRFAMGLARRLWFRLPWPDGQANVWPAETRTLWVLGDRNFAELLQVARQFGLPEEAVALGTTPDEPTEGLDLDEPEALARLAEHIRAAQPALVVMDTVGMVTSRNLCKPEDARAFFAPILDLAGTSGAGFLGLTHLSKDKEALGRRIVEKARVVLKMTQPDPEGQPHRRRLCVDKTAVEKPPALGVSMGSDGNDYDGSPPTEPEPSPRPRGPSPHKLESCKAWLRERLAQGPVLVAKLRDDATRAGHSPGTLYAARAALELEEFTADRRKWLKLPSEEDIVFD